MCETMSIMLSYLIDRFNGPKLVKGNPIDMNNSLHSSGLNVFHRPYFPIFDEIEILGCGANCGSGLQYAAQICCTSGVSSSKTYNFMAENIIDESNKFQDFIP